jgi:aspartate aminotransferase
LDAPEEYMLNMYNEYVERRKFLIDAINRIPGCYTPIPMGAFYTVARLPIDDADTFCTWLLESFEYENQTVMIAPASGFYTTPGVGKNEVRLAYVISKDDLAKAMVVLEKALEVYPGRVS